MITYIDIEKNFYLEVEAIRKITLSVRISTSYIASSKMYFQMWSQYVL